MQCEVLAFKPVKKGRVAVVRSLTRPDLIGEVPCAETLQAGVGGTANIKTRVTSRDGRITVVPILDN
jgi:hypothetical protein